MNVSQETWFMALVSSQNVQKASIIMKCQLEKLIIECVTEEWVYWWDVTKVSLWNIWRKSEIQCVKLQSVKGMGDRELSIWKVEWGAGMCDGGQRDESMPKSSYQVCQNISTVTHFVSPLNITTCGFWPTLSSSLEFSSELVIKYQYRWKLNLHNIWNSYTKNLITFLCVL